jgi:hypothetical protein
MTATDALVAMAIWLPALVLSLFWFARNTSHMTARFTPYEEYDAWQQPDQLQTQLDYYDDGTNDTDHTFGA